MGIFIEPNIFYIRFNIILNYIELGGMSFFYVASKHYIILLTQTEDNSTVNLQRIRSVSDFMPIFRYTTIYYFIGSRVKCIAGLLDVRYVMQK